MMMEQEATTNSPLLYSIPAAAKELSGAKERGGTSPWTLRRHAQRKNLKTVKLGTRVFIAREELDRIRREGLPCLTK